MNVIWVDEVIRYLRFRPILTTLAIFQHVFLSRTLTFGTLLDDSQSRMLAVIHHVICVAHICSMLHFIHFLFRLSWSGSWVSCCLTQLTLGKSLGTPETDSQSITEHRDKKNKIKTRVSHIHIDWVNHELNVVVFGMCVCVCVGGDWCDWRKPKHTQLEHANATSKSWR